jgi:hypothetical protein
VFRRPSAGRSSRVSAVALLDLDIATLFCSFYRFPWAFFRALDAFPASKIEGKPQ